MPNLESLGEHIEMDHELLGAVQALEGDQRRQSDISCLVIQGPANVLEVAVCKEVCTTQKCRQVKSVELCTTLY